MENSKIYFHTNTILNKKIPNYFRWWILLHMICLLFLILLFSVYKIEKKLLFIGYYQNSQVRLIVDEAFFELSTDKVRIQENVYSYEINKIDIIAYEEGKASLWEVWISLNLPDSWKIDNNQFKLSFIKEKTTVLKQTIKNIKKGMNL